MNDERPIEKLLRRAAQERSAEAGAPPELHPANRRLLQDEVAKQFPAPVAPTAAVAVATPTLWELLLRRWAYALGMIALVGLVSVLLLPSWSKAKFKSKSSVELARNPATFNASAAPPEAELAADVPAAGSDALRAISEGNGLNRGLAATTITTPPPAALVMAQTVAESSERPGGAASAKNLKADREYDSLLPLAKNPSARADKPKPVENSGRAKTAVATPTNPSTRLSLAQKLEATNALISEVATSLSEPVAADGERQRATLNSQAFSNLRAAQNRGKKPDARTIAFAPPVLMNFTIEQTGRDVRVVDGDGSIYRGVVDEANTVYRQLSARQAEQQAAANENKFRLPSPKAATPAPAPSQPIYFYQVTGTNRTLNQNIVFSWNFLPTNETAAAAQLDYQTVIKDADFSRQTSPFPVLLQNSHLNGRVQYGEGREIEINAVPMKP